MIDKLVKELGSGTETKDILFDLAAALEYIARDHRESKQISLAFHAEGEAAEIRALAERFKTV